MQTKAIEGYLENGRFYPMRPLERRSGRVKAILTVVDEPVKLEKPFPLESRMAWLNELKKMVLSSSDEQLPELPQRELMRPPHSLTDN